MNGTWCLVTNVRHSTLEVRPVIPSPQVGSDETGTAAITARIKHHGNDRNNQRPTKTRTDGRTRCEPNRKRIVHEAPDAVH